MDTTTTGGKGALAAQARTLQRKVATRSVWELDRLLGRAGYTVERAPDASWNAWQERIADEARRRVLAKRNIGLMIDVGANTGGFGTSIRNSGYRGQIVSFEPQRDCLAELRANAQRLGPWHVVPKAVGAETGTLEIHVAGNSLSSSLLPMLDSHTTAAPESRYVATEQVEVVRLDDALAEAGFGDRKDLYLKIDTQGYEWTVLQGAPATLDRAIVLEMELSFVPLYEGQKLFDELVAHVASKGFALHSMNEVFVDPATDRLLQVDGVFVRVDPAH
jgi:FkbM family methyltransferase